MNKMTSQSLTETTYRALRADVVGGRFEPGKKLKIGEVAERLCASPSVIREAMSRLASEGLVIAEPQRGFRIAPLEVSELRSLTDARVEIERLCLRDAIAHGGLQWESGIVATLHELSRTPEERGRRGGRVSDEWVIAHSSFHRALVSACGNSWYLKMRDMLYLHSERYRVLALHSSDSDRDLRTEHRDIAEATLAKDVKKVSLLIEDHLRRTMNSVIGNAETTSSTPAKKSTSANRSAPAKKTKK